MSILLVPVPEQLDKVSCGLCTATGLLLYYGRTPHNLRRELQVDKPYGWMPVQGTLPPIMSNVLRRQYGLRMRFCSLSAIPELLSQGIPVVAVVRRSLHWYVIVGETPLSYIVMNGQGRPERRSKAEIKNRLLLLYMVTDERQSTQRKVEHVTVRQVACN